MIGRAVLLARLGWRVWRHPWCELGGHDPSWAHAAALGIVHAPCCRRCSQPVMGAR